MACECHGLADSLICLSLCDLCALLLLFFRSFTCMSFFLLLFSRAVWAVANGNYIEARAAQAVVVQYPLEIYKSNEEMMLF